MMKSVQKAAALALCVFGLGQGAQADEAYPLCQTSSGIPGQLFLNMEATVAGPPGAKWALQSDTFNVEEGVIWPTDAPWNIWGTGIVTSLGISVAPLSLGQFEIAFLDEGGTEVLGTCRAEVSMFDQDTHTLDALGQDTCPLVGDIETPLAVGETREFERPTVFGSAGSMNDEVVSVEFGGGYQPRLWITGVGEGVANVSVGGPYSDPDRYYGFCAFVVTDN